MSPGRLEDEAPASSAPTGGVPRPSDAPTLAPSSSPADGAGMEFSPDLAEAIHRARLAASRSTITWRPPWERSRTGEPGMPEMRPGGDFGKYLLLEEVGRGGMGVVYKARQKGLDRLVAVKMILSSHLAGAAEIERFYAEAKSAAGVRDPHIVAIHDVGHHAGQHYFAMEYIDGPSLSQRLAAGPIDVSAAVRILATVARAVGRLHARGIVHRDLKPSNILLDASGRPFVTDFGLAKFFEAPRANTRSGVIVGTPSYMAPEQAAARSGEVGPRSDIYSLGAILYELIAGKPPFDEINPLDTLVQVLEGEPVAPSLIRSGIPRALEQICLKCLEKRGEDRYATAGALAEDLERFLAGEMVEARKLGAWTRLRRWSRREPALVSRLSTLALCAAIVQSDRLVTEDPDAVRNRRIMLLLGLGVLASLTFQGLLKRERWSSLARYTWATADITLFTSLVITSAGLSTSLVAGFFLLVAASGLWFRERLVWYTTALSVMAYGAVVGVDAWQKQRDQPSSPHLHVLFMMLLTVAGLIVGYQVRRVRALSHYYEHRPLP